MQPARNFANISLTVLFVFTVVWSCGLGFTCLDSKNNPVDWYIAYKIPKNTKSGDSKVKEGLAHFYLDVNVPEWKLSNYTIQQNQQAVYETLNQVYNTKDDDIMYLMYNDQTQTQVYSNKGHTKGVVAFNKISGFWIIHSVPHFPPKQANGYDWPPSASIYGQIFLCVSFKYEELKSIATQLLYNQPHIYDSNISQSIYHDTPILHNVTKGSKPSRNSSVEHLTSLNGQKFTSFAKSVDFGQDLYVDLVASNLKQNLLVQTWRSGQGVSLNSSCTTQEKHYNLRSSKLFHVMNINKINITTLSFQSTHDHSKWAVSFSSGNENITQLEKWTCIGDINRMKSQSKRGGGTLCLQNTFVWEACHHAVVDYEECAGRSARLNCAVNNFSLANTICFIILALLLHKLHPGCMSIF